MRYRSPDDKVYRIASLSGHVVLVGQEFVDILPHMEADARAIGCISEEIWKKIAAGEKPPPPPPAEPDKEQLALVIEQIRKMLDSDDESYFTSRGMPNRKVLDSLCGFSVDKDMFAAAWLTVEAEVKAL